jgi:hypothetical protein
VIFLRSTLLLLCLLIIPGSVLGQRDTLSSRLTYATPSCLPCIRPVGVERVSPPARPHTSFWAPRSFTAAKDGGEILAGPAREAPSRRFWGILFGATFGAAAGVVIGGLVGEELAPCGPEGPCLGLLGGAILGGAIGAILGGVLGAHLTDDPEPTSPPPAA